MAGRAELCRCFWCARWVCRSCLVRVRCGRAGRVWCVFGVGVPGGAGWYGSPMRTLHIDQGIYYNRKKKEKHEKRAKPAKPAKPAKTGRTVKTVMAAML